MTLTNRQKLAHVNPSNNWEPLIKPSVQQMMEKGDESQLTKQRQIQMKTDFFGTPSFYQPDSTGHFEWDYPKELNCFLLMQDTNIGGGYFCQSFDSSILKLKKAII